jgi:ABC-2 type transport system ATP-binding protein
MSSRAASIAILMVCFWYWLASFGAIREAIDIRIRQSERAWKLEIHLMTTIEVKGLVKTYPRNVRAVDDLSFEVEAGTVFALLGPNGAGKSTTVKILNTLSRPDAGTARVAGFDVLREPQRVRYAIGCVAQKSGVDVEATGRENLTLQGMIYGLRGRELAGRVAEMLDRFGLTGAADRMARTYSGGMQRKMDVAMGMIHRPRVLFLDEPTTGLDPEARADMWTEVARLSRDGVTVLLTTHYLDEADRLAQRLAIVDRGRLIAEGTPDQLKGQLLGDALEIELAAQPCEQTVRGSLDRLAHIREVAVAGRTLTARADHGATAVPAVIAALEAGGVGVSSVRVARPSLDDVYLRHAGRRFRDADEGARQ